MVLTPRGRGSVGRASPCQGEGRGFESRRPLQEVCRSAPVSTGPHACSGACPPSPSRACCRRGRRAELAIGAPMSTYRYLVPGRDTLLSRRQRLIAQLDPGAGECGPPDLRAERLGPELSRGRMRGVRARRRRGRGRRARPAPPRLRGTGRMPSDAGPPRATPASAAPCHSVGSDRPSARPISASQSARWARATSGRMRRGGGAGPLGERPLGDGSSRLDRGLFLGRVVSLSAGLGPVGLDPQPEPTRASRSDTPPVVTPRPATVSSPSSAARRAASSSPVLEGHLRLRRAQHALGCRVHRRRGRWRSAMAAAAASSFPARRGPAPSARAPFSSTTPPAALGAEPLERPARTRPTARRETGPRPR